MKRAQKIENLILKNNGKLWKPGEGNSHLKDQKVQRAPNKMNPKSSTPRHIII